MRTNKAIEAMFYYEVLHHDNQVLSEHCRTKKVKREKVTIERALAYYYLRIMKGI